MKRNDVLKSKASQSGGTFGTTTVVHLGISPLVVLTTSASNMVDGPLCTIISDVKIHPPNSLDFYAVAAAAAAEFNQKFVFLTRSSIIFWIISWFDSSCRSLFSSHGRKSPLAPSGC
jgi:hypothetical protein